jgi:hypothetical protein
MAKEMIELGFQFVTLLADNAFLAGAAKEAVAQMRGEAAVQVKARSAY